MLKMDFNFLCFIAGNRISVCVRKHACMWKCVRAHTLFILLSYSHAIEYLKNKTCCIFKSVHNKIVRTKAKGWIQFYTTIHISRQCYFYTVNHYNVT